MNCLSGKHVLLGVTGGIAAYKAAELVRLLRGAGASVRVVMTAGAQEFITPLTLQALSGNPVHTGLLDSTAEAAMGHIELARWADVLLIAPATADCLARLVQGRADDLLGAVSLACEAPKAIAPAMNRAMWDNPATQTNLDTLQARGLKVFGPDSGEQACGEIGPGRMEAPAVLVERLSGLFLNGRLAGRRVLVTAGPTREAIDPVRYISNHSSGRMGFAVARAAREAGAEVILVSGPVTLETPPGVRRIDVISAADMHAAVLEQVAGSDIFIAVAAVADYRPATVAGQKLHKRESAMTLELQRNPDILADVAALPDPPFTVGFAAETELVLQGAKNKRVAKRVDMIAANLVGAGHGFDVDENALHVIWENGECELPRTGKTRLAAQLVSLVADQLDSNNTHDKVISFNAKDSA
ncbi:MAG TPA: bifunctional phosphopantothenoylcysteine decarboxylase/phosphopantothenate--cysteine ligase CoaBC [Gammaproteobacteria bacterium]|jgi:phosphopantothenoylcysteine decarboxylase/phosphopantothenate--cysteine ligase|nr:bifunctional phosphopantothenoylcysteine decarboxylase/phosphopantothenate--cysteine ligase CoaBC [Gammaproteobacteria bacterium]